MEDKRRNKINRFPQSIPRILQDVLYPLEAKKGEDLTF